MQNKLKIKLSIANRVYPLTIVPEQEEGLRKATKRINTMVKQFEQSYAVNDKQDVLAMCALQFASQLEQQQINAVDTNANVEQKLTALTQRIQACLDA